MRARLLVLMESRGNSSCCSQNKVIITNVPERTDLLTDRSGGILARPAHVVNDYDDEANTVRRFLCFISEPAGLNAVGNPDTITTSLESPMSADDFWPEQAT